MAVKPKEDLIAAVGALFEDAASDAAISLLEDLADTLDTLSDAEEWHQKYLDNDKEWREKYTSRFFDAPEEKEDKKEEKPEDPELKYTYEELFEEGVH